MSREIVIERTIQLAAGGYIVVWHEPEGSQRHNTFTRNPTAWIEGYRNGQTLEALQQITEPLPQGS